MRQFRNCKKRKTELSNWKMEKRKFLFRIRSQYKFFLICTYLTELYGLSSRCLNVYFIFLCSSNNVFMYFVDG